MYLNAHTYFSLKYGILSVAQLVQVALDCGLSSLALTDINNTSAPLNFIRQCREAGICPVVGIEFRTNQRLLYLGLARNAEGFYQLNELLAGCSVARRDLPYPPRNCRMWYSSSPGGYPPTNWASSSSIRTGYIPSWLR